MTTTASGPEPADSLNDGLSVSARNVLLPGHRLGSFQIVRLLGVGGMGEVYLAERIDGRVDQRVAIKVLSHRMEAPQGRRRFQSEQQILARLSHPHIAKLFDAGNTPDGRAYFVMEWVDGEPLDAYAQRRGLDLRQRLLLFRKICSAVAYAHRNLVIHRDLKPSNILVDREGEPKLLDFGIAKWVGQGAVPGVDETQTLDGQSPMTPAFASPEQLAGESLTTSSDIYSLGILLYQLLTGQVPFSRKSWEKLDRDPVKPSEALAQAPTDDAPPIQPRQLRGDGDNILLQAVRLEIDHRYKDVAALDEDIAAFLNGDPVSAGRGTPFYLVRRLISRHRWATALSILVVVLFFVAFGLLAWQNRVITEERNRSNAEARRTALTRDFAVDLLRAVDASQRGAEEVTLEDLLGRGLARLKAGEVSDPIAHADLLRVIGNGYASLNALSAASQAYGLALERLDEALRETMDKAQISEIQAQRRSLLLLKIPSELRRGATEEASRSMGVLMELLAALGSSPEEDLVAWMRLTELHAITGKDKPFLEHHNAVLSRPLAELESDKMAVVTSLHHRLDIMLQRGRIDRAEEVLELTRKLVTLWQLEDTLFVASLKAYEGLIASSRHQSARAVAALTGVLWALYPPRTLPRSRYCPLPLLGWPGPRWPPAHP